MSEWSFDAAVEAAGEALADVSRLPEWMQTPALGQDLKPVAQLAVEAVWKLLDSWPFHVVEFSESGFVIQHPLSCRPKLFECQVSHAQPIFDSEEGKAGHFGKRFRCEVGAREELLIHEEIDVADRRA